jgi:xylulokinase
MTSIPVIAALDVGTSGVKVALIATNGLTHTRAYASYPTRTGTLGEVEQDPAHWWEGAVAALAQCAQLENVVALSVTGHMQDLICLDVNGSVRPAMLYSDTRAGAQFTRLSDQLPDWANRTGNVQDSSTVPAKIAWLAENEPQTLERATSLLFSASAFVLWRAGGESACDVTTASATGLLDVRRRGWYEDAVVASGARLDQLPRLVHDQGSNAIVGTLLAEAAAELGLPVGIPLVMAMGDAGSTTDGLVGSLPGSTSLYLGTTGWFAQVVHASTAEQAEDPTAPNHLHCLVLPQWQNRLRIGAVLSAGASSAWALSTFLPGLTFAQAETLVAARLESSSPSQLLCLPGLSGERTPVRDNNARGVFVGATNQTDALDFYIAVLVGVAMSLRHAADDLGLPLGPLALVGGATASASWRRIIASVFGVPVLTRGGEEPGTVSAALAAVNALELDHQIRPIFAGQDAIQETLPMEHATLAYRLLLPIHRGLYDALQPTFHTLAHLPSHP